ncbi:uncharacterized protein LOC124637287 isoform X1 [Helicoverpa zea]|uniref:uncharacterized protein LOC124637287 isoform X1 n=1 Tax=Helicoverpa zea TaxID=7113 RepID=UPI001F5A8C21|nr:uncharacterized protein LOC124637287 isoform X1 [Helicoverpa zea]
MCKDEAGVGLLHKAVYYDYMDIAEYLVKNYPQLVHQKDSEGRTPLHYSSLSRDSASLAALLETAGAARGARDASGRTPAHYRGHARELLALPDAMARDNKNAGLVIKRHNIRIWCHDCDMAKLQRVVWEGHGSRLLSEVSNQPVVKRFLEAVPYIMNTIRDIHTAVVQNDLEGLMKHAGDPVPPLALSSRDANNMTVMHKAAGLGHGGILKYIAERYPQGINDVDNDGRTPLHYAAAMRDDQHTYNTLVSLGADESVVDNKNKTPAYYINRPQEIDKNMFKTLPDAPRTPSSAYPNSWDWKLLDTEVIAELNKKSRRRNHKASNENISSKDTNTFTASEGTDNRIGGMKGSSTHELINNLPELDDAKPTKDDDNHIANVESNQDNEIDPEVTDLINNANMEMLATLVLNGEGSRLIGRNSRNSELQAFLDNVPTYMQKINKVHVAAREGNIRDLQAALDRRKFAIARDAISPNGATPLHVATIFGKTNIIKYLGGRFPETLSAVDFEGRTALHYAAVLPDNGHYYNLLQQLGANSKDLDDNGKSAEEYQKNPNLLPFDQLLSDYGISEDAAQSMFSDKVPEDQVSSRRVLDAPEALDTLERCYDLLASARPVRTPLSASSNRATPPLVLARFLKKPIFDVIKYRVTKLDHDLFDVIWPAVKKLPDNRNILQTVEEDFPGGVTAPDYYVYDVFNEFLVPLVKDLHNINVNSDLPTHPRSDFVTTSSAKLSSEPLVELNIDPNDEFVLSGVIECSRNLEGFELPLNLKVGKLETIERIVTTLLMKEDFSKFSEPNPESDQKGGTYYTMNEVLEKPSEICAALASSGLLIALCDRDEIDDWARLHGKHWPYGRGVFVTDDRNVAVWINVHDHIRVLVSSAQDSPGEIGLAFSKISYIMSYLHEKLDFTWDAKLGYLSARPTFLGAGIRLSLIVNFPGLSKDADNMKHLCAMRGLQYRETLSTDIARISNYQCLSITETNCFNDFATAASNLLHLEKDLSMQNSAHIATMLTNIFRKKRSSITGHESPQKREKI